MPELFLNHVGGRWVGSESKQTFPSINPANCDDVVGLFQSSCLEDVTAAFAAARAAQPAWAALLPETRGQELPQEIGQELAANA